ncbi:hypothetical protein [Streptomyces sp. NPDC017868]|uniref:hypothetical protein n=1 Tax=Streptomyces sp. NPDC017868 TaxID=3365014 RepID=UPI0037899ECA
MLLIHGGTTTVDAPVPRTGGVPLVPDGFVWPRCGECGGPMQFLVHLPMPFGVVAVFFCQNDPGMCDDWDATSGGNAAFLFRGELAPAAVPPEGETALGAVTALLPHPEHAPTRRPVLGRLGGAPEWLQDDETPVCPACARHMAFTAQLEEGHDYATAANFGGGGLGYVFSCQHCGEAAFLWQR